MIFYKNFKFYAFLLRGLFIKFSILAWKNGILAWKNYIFDFWAKNTPKDASKLIFELRNRKNTSKLIQNQQGLSKNHFPITKSRFFGKIQFLDFSALISCRKSEGKFSFLKIENLEKMQNFDFSKKLFKIILVMF